jgi:hypothetical protein
MGIIRAKREKISANFADIYELYSPFVYDPCAIGFGQASVAQINIWGSLGVEFYC